MSANTVIYSGDEDEIDAVGIVVKEIAMALSLVNFERFRRQEDWTEYVEHFQ